MIFSITNNKLHRRRSFLILILFLILICFTVYSQLKTVNFSQVQRVIDGDTFVLTTEERVRLLGVDTPELDSKIQREKLLAVQASDLTKSLVLQNKIRLEYEGPTKDIFGRTLCYIFLQNRNGKDSLFIQAELLKAGLARILMYPKQRRYYGLFYNLRNTAMRKHIGIWSK